MKRIYLDNQSTTPCDKRVFQSMEPYFCDNFGNYSADNVFGNAAYEAVERSRESVSRIIGADAREVIFTSSATMASNIAIIGCARFYGNQNKNHIITTKIEHKCVLDTCKALEKEGFDVSYISPDDKGLIHAQDVLNAINDRTFLVSVMAVNNEVGTIQPFREVGQICRSRGIFFYCDAAQAIGKIGIDVKRDNIDMLCISAHKIYGPKGVGALYVGSSPKVRLKPIFYGGGQEKNLHSGTVAVPLCVGLGEACNIMLQEMNDINNHVTRISKKFWQYLSSNLEQIYLNGDDVNRVAHNLNISFFGVEGESLMLSMPDVAVSSSSACSSQSLEPSYVLKAMGVKDELLHTAIRFGFGRFSSEQEVMDVARKVVENVQKLRHISPVF